MHADASDPGRPPRLSLLIVGGEAGGAQVEQALHEQIPGLVIRQVHRLDEAVALLERDRFDAVLADHELEGGTSLDLLEVLEAKAVAVPVVVQAEEAAEGVAVAVLRSGARDYLPREPAPRYLRRLPITLLEAMRRHQLAQQRTAAAAQAGQQKLLEAVRATVARVNHEINNPLAIISGNAQLLMELSRALGLDDEIGQPIQDIEEAARRLAASLRKLHDLKERFPST